MKALAVFPHTPHSMHLEDVPKPSLDDIAGGRGVLVQVLRVGVDGTDREINEGKYGEAPPGSNFLITGHENFGRVVAVGPNVPGTITPGMYVVATVRRPGHSIYDQIGEIGGHYVSSHYTSLAEASAQSGPFDIIFEATGYSPLAFAAAEVLGKNGVLILASITGSDTKVEVNTDRINQGFVLGNKVMVGTVNASRADFESGVTDFVRAEAFYPR